MLIDAVELENDRRRRLQNGRKLAKKLSAGEYVFNHNDQADVIRYRKSQRAIVARRGMCEADCRCELVVAPNGEVVCPNTWRRCPGRALVNIVSLLGKVNG